MSNVLSGYFRTLTTPFKGIPNVPCFSILRLGHVAHFWRGYSYMPNVLTQMAEIFPNVPLCQSQEWDIWHALEWCVYVSPTSWSKWQKVAQISHFSSPTNGIFGVLWNGVFTCPQRPDPNGRKLPKCPQKTGGWSLKACWSSPRGTFSGNEWDFSVEGWTWVTDCVKNALHGHSGLNSIITQP